MASPKYKILIVIHIILMVGIFAMGMTPLKTLANDTETEKKLVIKKGIVKDGEKVPIPEGFSKDEVTIHLSIRSITDHSQIPARIECYLEEDGVTTHIRSVPRFTNKDQYKYKNKVKEKDFLERGTANYLLIARESVDKDTKHKTETDTN